MKWKFPRTFQSYSPSTRSAKQISESFIQTPTKKAFRWKMKATSVHYVNLKQAMEKLETELIFLKDQPRQSPGRFSLVPPKAREKRPGDEVAQRCRHSWLKRPFSLTNDI